MIRISIARGQDGDGRPVPVEFDLFGLEVRETSKRDLLLRPSAEARKQDVRFAVLLAVLLVAILGVGAIVYPTLQARPDHQIVVAIVFLLITIPVLWGGTSFVKHRNQYCRIRRIDPRRIEITRKFWYTRRQSIDLNELESITFGVRQHHVQHVGVQDTTPIGVVFRFWIWYIALHTSGDSNAPVVHLRMHAESAAGGPPQAPPPALIQVGHWLRQATGIEPVPVTSSEVG